MKKLLFTILTMLLLATPALAAEDRWNLAALAKLKKKSVIKRKSPVRCLTVLICMFRCLILQMKSC